MSKMVSEPPTWFFGGAKLSGVQMKTWLLFCKQALFQHLLLFWHLECFCKPETHLTLSKTGLKYKSCLPVPKQPNSLVTMPCSPWLALSCSLIYLSLFLLSWPHFCQHVPAAGLAKAQELGAASWEGVTNGGALSPRDLRNIISFVV